MKMREKKINQEKSFTPQIFTPIKLHALLYFAAVHLFQTESHTHLVINERHIQQGKKNTFLICSPKNDEVGKKEEEEENAPQLLQCYT